MPPIYVWVHEETGEETEVQRDYEDSDLPPDDSGKWKKVIGKNLNLIRGPGWGGGKGNW